MSDIEEFTWTVIYLPAILVAVTIIIFVFGFFIAGHKDKLTSVPEELQAELISLRFTNSCFAYQDPVTGRIYPGVIDISKFTEQQLQRCYTTKDQNEFNFRLQLGDKLITTNNYFNLDHFVIEKKVLILEDNQYTPGTLSIGVQTRGRR